MTLISRDPFARSELHRESIYDGNKECNWCGSSGVYTMKGKRLFRYYVEQDRILTRKDYLTGQFCCIGCMRAYHGME